MQQEVSLNDLKESIDKVFFYKIFIDNGNNILLNQYLFEDSLYSSLVTSRSTDDIEVINVIFDFLTREDNQNTAFFSFLEKLGFTEDKPSTTKISIRQVGVAVGKRTNGNDSLLVFSVITVPDEMKGSIIESEIEEDLISINFKELSKVKELYSNGGLDHISDVAVYNLELFKTEPNKKVTTLLN